MYRLLPPSNYCNKHSSAPMFIGDMLDIGVTDHSGSCITEALHFRGKKNLTLKDKITERAASEKVWQHLPGNWYFGGIHFNHFGHFLTESVHRINFYKKHEHEFDGIVFLKANYLSTLEYQPLSFDFVATVYLDYFGIEKSRIRFIDQPTTIKNLKCMPQEQILSAEPDEYYLSELSEYTKKFIIENSSILRKVPEKIFLSRKNYLNMGRTLGISAVEEVFSQNGFEIICPEEKPMLQQLAIFCAAKVIAAEAGSALHVLDILERRPLDLLIISRRGNDANYWSKLYAKRTRSISVFDSVVPLDAYTNRPLGKSPAIAHFGRLCEYLRRWGLEFDDTLLQKKITRAFMEDLKILKLALPIEVD